MVRDINEKQGFFIDGHSDHSPLERTGSGVAEVLTWFSTSSWTQSKGRKTHPEAEQISTKCGELTGMLQFGSFSRTL